MSNFPEQSKTQQWQPSPRVALWTELERLHAKLELPPPTASLTIEDLQAEVERLKREAGE